VEPQKKKSAIIATGDTADAGPPNSDAPLTLAAGTVSEAESQPKATATTPSAIAVPGVDLKRIATDVGLSPSLAEKVTKGGSIESAFLMPVGPGNIAGKASTALVKAEKAIETHGVIVTPFNTMVHEAAKKIGDVALTARLATADVAARAATKVATKVATSAAESVALVIRAVLYGGPITVLSSSAAPELPPKTAISTAGDRAQTERIQAEQAYAKALNDRIQSAMRAGSSIPGSSETYHQEEAAIAQAIQVLGRSLTEDEQARVRQFTRGQEKAREIISGKGARP